jgi:hypothetical protein
VSEHKNANIIERTNEPGAIVFITTFLNNGSNNIPEIGNLNKIIFTFILTHDMLILSLASTHPRSAESMALQKAGVWSGLPQPCTW